MITSNVKSAGFGLLKVAKVSDENSGGGENTPIGMCGPKG